MNKCGNCVYFEKSGAIQFGGTYLCTAKGGQMAVLEDEICWINDKNGQLLFKPCNQKVVKEWYEVLVTTYKRRFLFTIVLVWIGLSDLILLVMTGENILHWVNDAILLFGGIGLTIVLCIKSMEDVGEL